MNEPTYPAARAVALKVQPHFARHLGAGWRDHEQSLAALPETEEIEAVVDRLEDLLEDAEQGAIAIR